MSAPQTIPALSGLGARVLRLCLCAFLVWAGSSGLAAASPPDDTFIQKVRELEEQHGGRLGVAMLRTKDGTLYTYRGDESFPLASTFKVLAVADLLRRSQDNPALLQQRLSLEGVEILPFSYAIRKYLKTGISLGQTAQICLLVSDNTAANLLLRELGGPEAVTAFARSIGDTAFRVDRWEMEMNESAPGDMRDTTSPAAMVHSLNTLLLGDALAPAQRDTLKKWMVDCLTGADRLPAGTPKSWTIAQKTGTGGYGTTNAVGILWPPVGSPLVLAVFYTQDDFEADSNTEIIAAVARLATQPSTP